MTSEVSERNRQSVIAIFDRWKAGSGDLFEMLEADVEWTIIGSRWPAGTYRGREQYLDAAVRPLFAKLATSAVPKNVSVLALDDQVVVRWCQDTPLKGGGNYSNQYAWFLTLSEGCVRRVDAFLDLDAYVAAVGDQILSDRDATDVRAANGAIDLPSIRSRELPKSKAKAASNQLVRTNTAKGD